MNNAVVENVLNADIPLLEAGGHNTLLGAAYGNRLIRLANAVRRMEGIGGIRINVSDEKILIDGGNVTGTGGGAQEIFIASITASDTHSDYLTCSVSASDGDPSPIMGVQVYKPSYLRGSFSTPKSVWPKYTSGDFLIVAYNSLGWDDASIQYIDLNIDARQVMYQVSICYSGVANYIMLKELPQTGTFV